jgi:hypothetical protein
LPKLIFGHCNPFWSFKTQGTHSCRLSGADDCANVWGIKEAAAKQNSSQ